mmetsp:Transcript_8846/g.19493  ORF Transcript_8846/g.19493 Transcript_8846/m.19493 type:complete len:251 (+) Transcript_8846:229-981(+)
MVRDLREGRFVRTQPHRRPGRHVLDEADVDHVPRPEPQGDEHPAREEDVVGRGAEVDRAADHGGEGVTGAGGGGGRRGDGDAGSGGDPFDAGDFEEPGDLDFASLDDPPETHGQAHFVARLDVAVRKRSHGRIEQGLVQGHGDETSSAVRLIFGHRAGDDFLGVVILDLLFQKGQIPRLLPSRLQERQDVRVEGRGGTSPRNYAFRCGDVGKKGSARRKRRRRRADDDGHGKEQLKENAGGPTDRGRRCG